MDEPQPVTSALEQIERLTALMNQLVESGDVSGIKEIMTEDVVFLPPNDTAKVGLKSYADWLAAFQNKYRVKIDVRSREIKLLDDWAFEWGLVREDYIPRDGSGAVKSLDGKFLRLFRREPGGTWRIARAVWNSSVAYQPT